MSSRLVAGGDVGGYGVKILCTPSTRPSSTAVHVHTCVHVHMYCTYPWQGNKTQSFQSLQQSARFVFDSRPGAVNDAPVNCGNV